MLADIWDEIKQIIVDKLKHLYNKYKYFLLILIPIIFIFLIFGLEQKNPEQIEEQVLYFAGISISNWAEWITIITIPITATWAIYQYTKSVKVRKQEKATEIAKIFSDELLDKCTIIWAVIDKSDLKDVLKLKSIDMNNLKRFDLDEILSLYNDKEDFLKKYQETKFSANVQLTYFYILERRISQKKLSQISTKNKEEIDEDIRKIMLDKYTESELESLEEKNMLKNEFERYMKANDFSEKDLMNFYRKSYTDEEARKLFIMQNTNLPFNFASLIDNVLNKLEYVCMYISSQSAGERFVYQSLHQVFLRTVKSLAVDVALRNKSYADKYYTNVIHVYQEWSKIRMRSYLKEKKNKKKAYKILEPKIEKI